MPLQPAAYRQSLLAVMTPGRHSTVLFQRILRSKTGPTQVSLLYRSCSPADNRFSGAFARSWLLHGMGSLQSPQQALIAYPHLLTAAIQVSLATSA